VTIVYRQQLSDGLVLSTLIEDRVVRVVRGSKGLSGSKGLMPIAGYVTEELSGRTLVDHGRRCVA